MKLIDRQCYCHMNQTKIAGLVLKHDDIILGLCISKEINQICDIHEANPIFPLFFFQAFFIPSSIREVLDFFVNREKS